MTELRDVLVIGIVLVAALAVSACLEIATDLKEWAPVVATSADETAANATDADNRMDEVPVRNLSVTALSNTSADENDPVWSPDGRRIFFKSDDRICVCDPDGSHREELAEIEWNSLVMDPEQKRAFYKNRTCTVDGSEETYQAYVMDIDGKNLTKIASLTLEDEYVDDGGYIGGTRMLAYDTHSWSPDRTEIFVTKLEETGYTWVWSEDAEKWVRYRAGTEPSISVLEERGWEGQKLIAKEHLKTAWVWDLKENELRFIGNLSYGIVHGILGGLVVWSPDGKHVALSCLDLSEAGSTGQIFVINMETGESRRLTSFVGSSTCPGWSPDGKKIMYVRMPPKYWWSPYIGNSDEGVDVWVVDIDGSNEKQLTDIPENWEGGFWSPDGKRMVYASWKPGFMGVGETREIEVRMVNEDGGDERLLTTITTGFIVRMVWSPDGSKIAVVAWELVEDGIDRDIYTIDMPATEEAKNENRT
jgi:Tol biopolymer transport system component